MKPSETKLKQIEELKAKARILYRELGTYRLVGEAVKRSHQWVANAIKETGDKWPVDETLQK